MLQRQKTIATIENYDILFDYATFKDNVLKYIDCGRFGSRRNFKIKQKNLKDILKILEKNSKHNPDDAVVLAYLNGYGVVVPENKKKAN